MVARRHRNRDTATAVLDVAEKLVQTRGFNGFSYADVAAELNVTKAAMHYHFASKAELGEALLTRYTQRFASALESIRSRPIDAPAKLAAYAELYLEVLQHDRMCLCGMMAAEYQTLPESMQAIVLKFFVDNETWLTCILDQGKNEGSLNIGGSTDATARMVVASFEGAMLVSRPFHDHDRFRAASSAVIKGLAAR